MYWELVDYYRRISDHANPLIRFWWRAIGWYYWVLILRRFKGIKSNSIYGITVTFRERSVILMKLSRTWKVSLNWFIAYIRIIFHALTIYIFKKISCFIASLLMESWWLILPHPEFNNDKVFMLRVKCLCLFIKHSIIYICYPSGRGIVPQTVIYSASAGQEPDCRRVPKRITEINLLSA